MVKANARAEIGIFEGNNTIELVRIRTNNKTGRMEVKSNGIFSRWRPIYGEGIPLENVGCEKDLIEDGIKTKIRAVRFKQSVEGESCREELNPRFVNKMKELEMESIRMHRLCRFYYDTLVGITGKDKFKEMMKDHFRTTKEVKQEGATLQDFDTINRFGGARPSLGLRTQTIHQ